MHGYVRIPWCRSQLGPHPKCPEHELPGPGRSPTSLQPNVVLSPSFDPLGLTSIFRAGTPDGDGYERTVVPKKQPAYQLEVTGYGKLAYNCDTLVRGGAVE